MGKRGQKICDKCQTPTGPRTKRCKECGQGFSFKPKSQRRVTGKPVEWRTLRPGNVIKAIQSTGPVYVDKETGEETSMGYSGNFLVRRLDATGIQVVGYKVKGENGDFGTGFIYMGPEKISKTTGLLMRPHKIELLSKDRLDARERPAPTRRKRK